ncbi:hypothetical protein MPH_06483 [Macrophomina phaseolina MS6]|uniref:Uncharacterized protein n=1 Tax=Macrophomina phaseolina (strain MS6) TaxID=1126212 RepID=K2RNJ6_MACPH|nr:hypothetical protein MPH_06483 [Macrophomina phaseolina MS6]
MDAQLSVFRSKHVLGSIFSAPPLSLQTQTTQRQTGQLQSSDLIILHSASPTLPICSIAFAHRQADALNALSHPFFLSLPAVMRSVLVLSIVRATCSHVLLSAKCGSRRVLSAFRDDVFPSQRLRSNLT